MAEKWILLYDIEQIMLIVEHPSGVKYQNQVGGNVCCQEELEGVLSPLDVSPEVTDRIENCPYPGGIQGITAEIADTIDALLASASRTSFLKVDRARLDDSWEAWVYVLIDSPESTVPDLFGPYAGSIYGFGAARGVLTWPNSD